MKRDRHQVGGGGGGGFNELEGKMKATVAEDQDSGVDELLRALGYTVWSSDMEGVAQKLEQLEVAMATGGFAPGSATLDNDGDSNNSISLLASDTVHYNPSDLSSWLESMLSELNVPPPPPGAAHEEISAGNPIYREESADPREKKRIKSMESSSSLDPAAVVTDSPSPMVLLDSQETGIRLVHALLACAEAVQNENLKVAEALVNQIGALVMSHCGAMRKVATYFAEALARWIYRIRPPQPDISADSALSDVLHSHFYEACPYLKFAHFSANQAILEAFSGRPRVHVVDFGIKQGVQWPALLQALALRPGGPPSFRLTGVGPDPLQQVGSTLAQFAESIHVEFEYRGVVVDSLADLEPYMLDLRRSSSSSSSNSSCITNSSAAEEEEEDEAVAVNSVFELHRVLGQPGAIEKVLGTIRAARPTIVTMVEQEANHNGPVFLDRFTEALHYYSTMFDSLEGCTSGGGGGGGSGEKMGLPLPNEQDKVMSEVYLGREICNVVACEGPDRTERHETAGRWRGRMSAAGFEVAHLGSNAFKQASMLLELFGGGDGYRVEEKEGCLMLGWHNRPLITTSAWHCPSSSSNTGSAASGRHNNHLRHL